jgi:hypothetical protein
MLNAFISKKFEIVGCDYTILPQKASALKNKLPKSYASKP